MFEMIRTFLRIGINRSTPGVGHERARSGSAPSKGRQEDEMVRTNVAALI